MDTFDKEFIMEMFLDNESVSSMNRLIVATTDIIKENNDNAILAEEIWTKEDDSEDVELSESNHISRKRVRGFYENTVLQYSDKAYEFIFKMKRTTCQELIKFLKDYVKGGMIVPLEKKVHVFLWVLTSDASFQEVGKIFGLNKSTVSYIFYEIAQILTENRYHYISWPSIEEQHLTRVRVNSRVRFPNCVGFLDAVRLPVGPRPAPRVPRAARPRHVLLQAVCDDDLMFTDIYVGAVGRTKKHKVFKESPLYHELSNFIEFENHLLADASYKLRVNLITPFTSEEVLTDEEMKFNEAHWRARGYIGRAFELLQERFRKLRRLEAGGRLALVLGAAAVLHNLVLLHEGAPDVKQEPPGAHDAVAIDTDIVRTAAEKRQFLCNYINFIDDDSI
ncbi:unnamed protein product [Plutella xylostella]|uniref:(diamondback moth) hypothetical protein n=1 Tax=Plutella xylostella TaxID=51655 RepID=A0A8S4EPR6_PLUXY|nr:unnamed protein product [Plutella xylostella]